MTTAVLAAVVAVAAVVMAGAGGPAGAAQEATVGREVPVTAMDHGAGVANNSPTLLGDPTDSRVIVLANRFDSPDFNCNLHISGDRGRSWTPLRPVPQLPPGADKCYAPEVAFDAEGALYYLFVGLAGGGNEPMGAFLTVSTDRGRTFSPPVRVLGRLEFGVRMAIDPTQGARGRLHLVWLHASSDPELGGFGPPPNPIMTKYSDDAGRTFSEPVQVSDPDRPHVVAPSLTLGPGGAVHVGYYDLGDDLRDYRGLDGPVWEGSWSLVVTTSRDAGLTFRPAVVVTDAIGPPGRVMLVFTMPPAALAANGSQLCAGWTDARHGDPDVLVSCSTDAGERWPAPVRVNDDPIDNGKTQYLPRVGISPRGRVDVVFYDRRTDPQNVLNDVYFTTSDDGRRFDGNVRVTRESFESRIGAQYANLSAQGQFEYGSRLGILSRLDDVVLAWTDTRNSRLTPGSTGQDVFAATVTLAEATGDTSINPLLVPGLVVVAIMAVAVVRGVRRREAESTPVSPPP